MQIEDSLHHANLDVSHHITRQPPKRSPKGLQGHEAVISLSGQISRNETQSLQDRAFLRASLRVEWRLLGVENDHHQHDRVSQQTGNQEPRFRSPRVQN